MNAEPDLARIAGTVGDPRRIQMLALLMEGRALTAKELALGAGVEPATATAHLKRLLADGLLSSRPRADPLHPVQAWRGSMSCGPPSG